MSRSRTRYVPLLVLAAALACTDRPTEPARAARAPRPLLDERGDQLLVVGSTVRGVALLEVELRPRDGGEPRRWVFENARPDDEEAWGSVALAPGGGHELVMLGYDREHRPLVEGTLALDVGKELVAQVRARAELADGKADDDDPPELYAGSLRVATAPRWVDDPRTGADVVAWLHDARGERVPLDEEGLDVRALHPELGLLDVVPDPEGRQVDIALEPYPPPERIPPGQVLYVCRPGDVTCGRTFVRFVDDYRPPHRGSYRKVVAGETALGEFTCALGTGGLAACWGDASAYGGLTPQARTRTSSGLLVNELAWLRLADIAVGKHHGCAVTTFLGEAWCWGWNDQGQLGSGTTGDAPNAKPHRVPTALRFAAIAAGAEHSCAIDVAGEVWCWGSNALGQLGDGTGGAAGQVSIAPVRARPRTGTAVAIEAGARHTCVLTTAGSVECWGSDELGQVGTQANTTCSAGRCTLVPEPVETDPVHFHNRDVVAVAAGGSHSCAVVRDGRVFCWGVEDQGGNVQSVLPQPTPRGVAGTRYRGVAVGDGHACAILDNGAAHCWGVNHAGQLGRGTISPFERGANLVMSPPAAYHSLGLGPRHSCGIREDRLALHCWGAAATFDPARPQHTPQPVLVTNF